jgi:glycosyltransferase involved in cell wall biosynthesis
VLIEASSPPWLSILIPVYNAERYVADTVASVLRQVDEGVEVVLADDGSKDGSRRALQTIERENPARVRLLLRDENRGLSATRNELLASARGEHVWFMDADDLMEPGAVAELKTIVQKHDPDLVLCDFHEFYDDRKRRIASRFRRVPTFAGTSEVVSDDRDALVRGLFTEGWMHAWSKIVRRRAWPDTLRFPIGRIFEDVAVYPRLALAVRTHYHTPRVWIAYRQHAKSVLGSIKHAQLDDWVGALVGYVDDARAAGITLNDETYFWISHKCATWFGHAVEKARRFGERGPSLARFSDQFRRASPLTAAELSKAYRKRGWIGRWIVFNYWQWRAG